FEKADLTLQGRTVSVVLYGKNSGLTPAYGVTSRLFLDVRSTDENFVPPENRPMEGEPLSGIIGPGGTFEPNKEIDLIETNVLPFQGGKAVVYASGQVDYTDAFGTPRYLKFRFKSVRRGNGWAFQPTPKGNEAN